MRLERITIAAVDMTAMHDFYSKVLLINFDVQTVMQHPVYQGVFDGLGVLLIPAAIAGIEATENRHQLELRVDSLEEVITVAQMFGGTMMDEVVEDSGMISAGILDPDGNSLVFKQYLS